MDNVNQNELSEQVITTTIALMSQEDKATLVNMLKRSGSLVDDLSTQQQLLDASFKALKESPRFRSDLNKYVKMATQENAQFSNYVDGSFYNQSGGAYKKEHGYTRVGGALRSIFSAENVSALAGAGIGLLSAKLQSQATKGSDQRAIDYKVAEANAALAEAERLKLSALTPSASGGKNKWVVPVAIGGGVILIGVILFVALRKN